MHKAPPGSLLSSTTFFFPWCLFCNSNRTLVICFRHYMGFKMPFPSRITTRISATPAYSLIRAYVLLSVNVKYQYMLAFPHTEFTKLLPQWPGFEHTTSYSLAPCNKPPNHRDRTPMTEKKKAAVCQRYFNSPWSVVRWNLGRGTSTPEMERMKCVYKSRFNSCS